MISIVLGKLAIRCRDGPRLERIFIVNYLPKIYSSFSTGSVPQLSCCEICLKYYPQDSVQYKANIEKILRQQIDSLDVDVSYLVGKCFHLMQCVRDKNGSKSLKEQWSNHVELLFSNIHVILNRLYGKYTDNFHLPIEDSTESSTRSFLLAEDKLEHDSIEKFAQLYIQLRNLVIYLMVTIR